MVSKAEKDGSVKFVFNSREDARYVEGVESPDLLRKLSKGPNDRSLKSSKVPQ